MARDASNELRAQVQHFFREGIELEKGAILTEEYLIKNENLFERYANFFSAYPDIFVDLITPTESNFSLFFF